MAHIVVLRHADERPDFSRYSLSVLAAIWEEQGHRVTILRGLDSLPEADLAFLHVDLSVVPEAYAAAARRYPHVVNGKALDIRKRIVSRHILERDHPWPGPVLVKSDLNYGGIPEWRIEHPDRPVEKAPARLTDYRLFKDLASVPEDVWSDPHWVVERFLPERDDRGFYIRTWLFLGDRGRCRRSRSQHAIIKGEVIVEMDPDEIPVPDFIRAERERLGIDYGKFDFALYRGRPVLFDANKTPGVTATPGNRLYYFLGEALGTLLG
jgi:hypothetical protein